jgi:hypothetical protein
MMPTQGVSAIRINREWACVDLHLKARHHLKSTRPSMRQHRSLSLSLVPSTCTTVGMFSARRIDVRMLSPAFNNDPDWPEVQHSKTNKSSNVYTIESIDCSFTTSN